MTYIQLALIVYLFIGLIFAVIGTTVAAQDKSEDNSPFLIILMGVVFVLVWPFLLYGILSDAFFSKDLDDSFH